MLFKIDLLELQAILKTLRVSVKPASAEQDGRLTISVKAPQQPSFSTSTGYAGTEVRSSSASVELDGAVCISYTDLSDFINNLKPPHELGGVESVTLKLSTKFLVATAEGSFKDKKTKVSRRIKILPEVTYPNLNIDTLSFSIDADLLKYVLDKTIPFIDPIHPMLPLRGMSLILDSDKFYFAGTNGVVLSEFKVDNSEELIKEQYLFSYDFIKGLRGVVASLSKGENKAYFYIDKKIAKVIIDNVTFWGQMLSDQLYPEYKKELIKSFKYKFIIDRQLLLDNLTPLIGALDKDDNNRLTIQIKDSKVLLYNDLSEADFMIEDSVPSDFIIDVNGKLCRDLINNIRDDNIIMYCTDDKTNIIFDSHMFEDQKTLLTFIRRRSL